MSRTVTVIGVDDRPLAPAARDRLSGATLVVGAARHLDALPVPPGAARVVLGGLAAGLEALAAHDGAAVVLASGDPGFFGILRVLRERGVDPEVIPAVGSVATVCARAGVAWNDAVVVSAHGRGESAFRRAVNACRALPKVAVLTAPGSGPAELGSALAATDRRFVVGEQLGTPAESVTRCTPAEAAGREWSEPNVVLVVSPAADLPREPAWAAPIRQSPASWALDEECFDHRDGMVTKSEVRALALAKLAPGLGDLIWDIGAGSGSVAVECARFCAAAVAVERDEDQCKRIAANAAAHGVEVEVVQATAPQALAGLPAPDAVFIGGGGGELAAIVSAVVAHQPRAVVVTLAALERVEPVSRQLRAAGYATGGVQLSAARLASLPDGATRLAAQNPVFVLWGTFVNGGEA